MGLKSVSAIVLNFSATLILYHGFEILAI